MTELLDCSEYIDTDWKADCYMGDKPEDVVYRVHLTVLTSYYQLLVDI